MSARGHAKLTCSSFSVRLRLRVRVRVRVRANPHPHPHPNPTLTSFSVAEPAAGSVAEATVLKPRRWLKRVARWSELGLGLGPGSGLGSGFGFGLGFGFGFGLGLATPHLDMHEEAEAVRRELRGRRRAEWAVERAGLPDEQPAEVRAGHEQPCELREAPQAVRSPQRVGARLLTPRGADGGGVRQVAGASELLQDRREEVRIAQDVGRRRRRRRHRCRRRLCRAHAPNTAPHNRGRVTGRGKRRIIA